MARKPKVVESSKITKSLKPLLLLHLIFGYDYGLFNHKNIVLRYFIKVISTKVVIALAIFGLFREIFNKSLDSFFLYPVQYFLEALLITFLHGPKILKHLNSFTEIDEVLKISDKYYQRLKRRNIIFILITFIAIMMYMTTLTIQKNRLKITCILLFILDLSYILRINLFNIILYRVIKLRKIVERHYMPIDLSKDLKKRVVEIDPMLHVQLYKELVERLKNFTQCIELTFMFGLAVSLSKLILLLYDISIATTAYDDVDMAVVIISLVLAIHTALLLCLPGVINEMSAAEVDKLRRVLCNRLLENIDEREEKTVQMFLQFVLNSPIEYYAWRMVHVNNQMIISLAWFCATTLIIIMQFS